MRTFPPGSRVLRTETGEVGTVRRQFPDGSVTVTFDDGRPAELESISLQFHHEDPAHLTDFERLRLAIVDTKRCSREVQALFLNTAIENEDDVAEAFHLLWIHRPNIVQELATAMYFAERKKL